MTRVHRAGSALLLTGAAVFLYASIALAVAGTYGDIVSVAPQPVAPGATLSVHSTSWEHGAQVTFFWNHGTTPLKAASADSTGVLDTTVTVPTPLANGTYDIEACEMAVQSCAGTPASHSVVVAKPPPPTPPPPTPTPIPTPTPLATPSPLATPPVPVVVHAPSPHPTPRRPSPRPAPTPKATPGPSPTPSPSPSASPTPALPAVVPAIVAASPSQGPTPSASPSGLATYDPASEARKTVNLAVSSFALLAFTGAGGLAVAGAGGVLGVGGHPTAARGPGAGKVPSATIKYLKSGAEAVALGDRSWTWRLPGTAWLDALSFALPQRLAARLPLVARLVTDGSYLRAVLGSAYLALPVAGVAAGVAAALSTAGEQVPVPSLVYVLVLLVLGVVDGFSAFAGVLAFAAVLGIGGRITSAADVRVLMGLGGMWFVTPLLAGAARPLRRVPSKNIGERWDRGADFVIASLVGAWAVQKIVAGLSGLAGYHLPIARDATVAALIVLVALVGRLAAETLAANIYPRRLAEVQPAMVMSPPPGQRLAATGLRAVIFTFLALPFIGVRWQLAVGVALFLLPQVLSIYEQRFPNHPRLYHYLPRGILKTVVMLFVGSLVGGLALRLTANPHELLADAFVVCSLPGVILSLFGLLGRDGPETPLTWWHRGAGAVVLGIGILFALGVLS